MSGSIIPSLGRAMTDTPSGKALRTTATISGIGNILEGITFDEIQAAYPTATTETYTYLEAAVTQAIITVTYTDATKEFIQSVVRT